MSVTEDARNVVTLDLMANFQAWSAHCAKVLPKEGGAAVPFIWNRAQRFIHERLEEQLRETGQVRALLLKGRQQGGSTYIGARFYHKTSTTEGLGAFIVAHEDKATANLFKMVKRYHEHNPMAPSTRASNAQELIFGAIDSGYKLATAGSKDVGRSNTARLFHGSEFAFWDNAQMHLAGVGNTIPSGALGVGTEIILESTANGLGNAFHLMWQEAEAGRGEYIAIFVPWYWQDEYRKPPRETLDLSQEDERYQATYGLDSAQMQWRADKISEYGKGFEWLFDQEYPATAQLAFRSPTGQPLINPVSVSRAVHSGYADMNAPLVIGCDPASEGVNQGINVDRTAIAFRRGRVCYRIEYHSNKDEMAVCGILAAHWKDHRPDGMFIDKGGIGAGIYSRLRELNIPVQGVMFGGGASDPELYANKRAEIWWRMKEWLEDEPNRIPDDAALQADLSAPQPKRRSNGSRLLESKEDMAKRQIRSPDGGDALALTFAEPVEYRNDGTNASTYEPPTTAGY